MAKQNFEIPLFLCSSLLLSITSVAVASPYPSYPLQKTSNCQDRCGNISIPYPFGIGANCFKDEQYEILCSNDSIPRLKELGLQVLNISVPPNYHFGFYSTITVNYPVVYSNTTCAPAQYYRGPQQETFYGSPFYFSRIYNIFVAVGCEKHVRLKGSNHSYVGCSTECSTSTTSHYSSCNGSDCCQSTLPPGLQSLSIEFEGNKSLGTNEGYQDCHFAFLVNSTWFEPNSTDLYAIREGGSVPVVLEWGILDAAFPTSIGLENVSSQSDYYYYYSQSADCEHTSINVNTTTFIYCYCRYGYYGNPYIEDGCKDINECEIPLYDGSKRCNGLHTCKNTRGSYHCVRTNLNIIIGVCSSFGPLLLIFLAWCTYKLIKKRREAKLRAKFFRRNGGLILQKHLSSPEGNVERGRLFNCKELEIATNHFNKDRILGKGGQGTVYKGMLGDGRIVAIKKSLTVDEEDVEPFINEVVILSQINHRNVVKLLGCCLESEVPLLVYEFIPNGTLYQYLHDQEFPFSWEDRLRITMEIAGALFYLHSSASIPIYHRDIKSSNILLDEKYRAKIADFGASRSVALDQTHVTTVVQGTFGYLDPEYFQSSQFTDKSDVYSFGVVLVELLTGQKPVSSLLANEGRSLATFFITSIKENQLFDILDAHVLGQGKEEAITAVANLAKRCLNLKGRKRPAMKEVVMELEGIRNPVLRTSRVEEDQESEGDHIESEISDQVAAFSIVGRSQKDVDIISLSDAHPLLPSGTW